MTKTSTIWYENINNSLQILANMFTSFTSDKILLTQTVQTKFSNLEQNKIVAV